MILLCWGLISQHRSTRRWLASLLQDRDSLFYTHYSDRQIPVVRVTQFLLAQLVVSVPVSYFGLVVIRS